MAQQALSCMRENVRRVLNEARFMNESLNDILYSFDNSEKNIYELWKTLVVRHFYHSVEFLNGTLLQRLIELEGD